MRTGKCSIEGVPALDVSEVSSPPRKHRKQGARRAPVLLLALAMGFAPAALPGQAEDRISMRIDVVAWGDDIGGLSFKAGKEEGQITARAFSYSDPVNYTGPRLLQIHQSGSGNVEKEAGTGTPEDKEHESIPLPLEETQGDSSGQDAIPGDLAKRRIEEPTLVALVPLPAGARRVTVLLAPSAGGTYRGYVINDDPSRLPPGKLRVHNLSPHPVAMQFQGGQREELKPRGTCRVDVRNGHTVYQLAYKTEDKWVVQENNIIPVRPDEQTQMIVLKSTNQFFLSADGASGGYLQMVTLRRQMK